MATPFGVRLAGVAVRLHALIARSQHPERFVTALLANFPSPDGPGSGTGLDRALDAGEPAGDAGSWAELVCCGHPPPMLLRGGSAAFVTAYAAAPLGLLDPAEWSYDRRSPAEQLLWARLSAFAGSFDVEAAEQSCADERLDARDVLATLAARGEEEMVRERHLDRYRGLAVYLGENPLAGDQFPCYRRLRLEHADLRAALEYALAAPGRQRDAAAMAISLDAYWQMSSAPGEGRHWLGKVLPRLGELSRGRALALIICLFMLGDLGASVGAFRTALAMKHEIADTMGIGYALEGTAWLAAAGRCCTRAAWLLGAADARWQLVGGRLGRNATAEALRARAEQAVRDALGEARYRALHDQGAGYPLEEIVRLAAQDKLGVSSRVQLASWLRSVQP